MKNNSLNIKLMFNKQDISFNDMYIALENEFTKPKTIDNYMCQNDLTFGEFVNLLQVYYYVYDYINVYINNKKYITFYRSSYIELFKNIGKVVFNE